MIVDECLLKKILSHAVPFGREPFHLAYCAANSRPMRRPLLPADQILLNTAMICDRNAQTILIIQCCIGWQQQFPVRGVASESPC